MKKQSKEVPKIFPITAQFGSFEVKVSDIDDQIALNALENNDKLFQLLDS